MQYGVLRYNLVTNKAEFIERLPLGWDGKKCTWLVPLPDKAPIKKITKKSKKACAIKHQQQLTSSTPFIHIERHYEPCFKVLVRNLPLTVKSSQLQVFFSNHGKVSSAKVIYHKKTKRSQGIGHVTMSTMHAHLDDALDALDDLVLDGCRLDVSLVKKGRRRWRQ
ncbi:28 kDa ribonucleoprotein, chloroplastic-like [Triticum aestivum]|uniref:28 kDa ribonucleoprotein, chloroplastic-like n=1 Tax=Triticum aestivum TaxID=4565 RepID=UPI001D020005|nr:28 kDa ribonucleoprotein, chloroplastic-like [Triticum aestivum]